MSTSKALDIRMYTVSSKTQTIRLKNVTANICLNELSELAPLRNFSAISKINPVNPGSLTLKYFISFNGLSEKVPNMMKRNSNANIAEAMTARVFTFCGKG